VTTTTTLLALLPFTPGIIFFLPSVLITDEVLQALYRSYGDTIEVVVDDTKQMAKLAMVVGKLSVRQSYRLVKRQVSQRGWWWWW